MKIVWLTVPEVEETFIKILLPGCIQTLAKIAPVTHCRGFKNLLLQILTDDVVVVVDRLSKEQSFCYRKRRATVEGKASNCYRRHLKILILL